MMKWWLIRYADHSFSRPIPDPMLISKIEAGELNRKDEICVSEGYWFAIQDVIEVRKFLGEVKLDTVLVTEETSTTLPGSGVTRANLSLPVTEPQAKPAEAVRHRPSITRAQPVHYESSSESSFVLPEEQVSSIGSRIALILVFGLIFLGTVYLLWAGSKS
jgi:hypothetical protein